MHICAHKATLLNTDLGIRESSRIEKQGKRANSAATGEDKNITEHEKRGRKSLTGWERLQKLYVV